MLHTKIISGILSFIMMFSPIGFAKGNSGTKPKESVTVTVAADGSGDYTTLEAARDYVRTLDKSKYSEITVRIAEGSYYVEKTIEFTAKDGGEENCPIRYIGDGKVEITGVRA